MAKNPENGRSEGGYEDSAERRKRLEEDYAHALNEVEKFIELSGADSEKITESVEQYIEATSNAKDAQNRGDQLNERLKALEAELATLAEDDKGRPKIEAEINDLNQKFAESIDESMTYSHMADVLFKEHPGLRGDLEGTKAVIKLLWDKVENIRRQLEE